MSEDTLRIAFTVNGVSHELEVPPLRRLLDVLREDLGLCGTKEGCGEGECGACSVLDDGEVVNSCLIPACQIDGHAITTIEGPGFASIQDAFLVEGAAQCGICTPGMIVATRAWLDRCARDGVAPTPESTRSALAGNLCRCTGYASIVRAALLAARGGT